MEFEYFDQCMMILYHNRKGYANYETMTNEDKQQLFHIVDAKING